MPVIVPPVMATADAACAAIVPRPVMAVLGIVADAVNAAVPFPLTYPVRVEAPVPPSATASSVMPVIVPPVIFTADIANSLAILRTAAVAPAPLD